MFPVGLLMGRAMLERLTRNAQPAQRVVRTSAMVASSSMDHSRRPLLRRRNPANPFEKEQMINRIGGYSIRRTHKQAVRDHELLLESLKDEKWTAVYRYPGVRYAVLLARAKLIQTIASVIYLPYSVHQYLNGQADSTWFYSCATLAVIAPIALAIFSRYLNRLIGVIAMNETSDYIRVGYLTFWGSRKNMYLEVEDVLPLAEMGVKKEAKLVKFMWYSSDKFLYLPIQNSEIVDEKKAELLFGDLTVFDMYRKQE